VKDKEIIDYYALKHSKDESFSRGTALIKHMPYIAQLIQKYEIKSILDYGCGKAIFWKNNVLTWKVMFQWPSSIQGRLSLYDPAINEDVNTFTKGKTELCIHNTIPAGRSDLVICTDVLEHVPEHNIPSTLDSILIKSRRFVYLNISCYAATKTFPDGTNLHLTLKSPAWWREQIAASQDRVFDISKSCISIDINFDEDIIHYET
jgi:hypothetical protein